MPDMVIQSSPDRRTYRLPGPLALAPELTGHHWDPSRPLEALLNGVLERLNELDRDDRRRRWTSACTAHR